EAFDESEYSSTEFADLAEITYVEQRSLLNDYVQKFKAKEPNSISKSEAVEKFHYLKSCLKGPAEKLIRPLTMIGDNYSRAWALLSKHYENKRELSRSNFSTFIAVAKMKSDTAEELNRIQCNQRESIDRPIDLHGFDLLNHLVIELFDPETRLEWESLSSASNDVPTHEALVNFITKKALTLNTAKPKSLKVSEDPPRSAKSHHIKRHTESPQCVLCKGKHYVMVCEGFKKKFAVDSKAAAETHRLCFNCLGSHTIAKCQSTTCITSNDSIELLFGAEVCSIILQNGLRKRGLQAPIAQKTLLGWILSGGCDQVTNSTERHSLQCTADHELAELVHHFVSETDLYRAFLKEYEVLDHMKLAREPPNSSEDRCYLPHHGVLRESSTTTKLKVVFNGSQRTRSGESLNTHLLRLKHQTKTRLLMAKSKVAPIKLVSQLTLWSDSKVTLHWIQGHASRWKTYVRAVTPQPQMRNLPPGRVTPAWPFLRVGIDYAGPIFIRMSKGHGHSAHKAFIAVFVCFSSKAVHLKSVSDYITDAFLAALRRFTSRRGLCTDITPTAAPVIQQRYKNLGPLTFHEFGVATLFFTCVFLWIFRKPGFVVGWSEVLTTVDLRDSVPVIFVSILMFFIPKDPSFIYSYSQNPAKRPKRSSEGLITWKTIETKMPWSLMFLLGGGFAISRGSVASSMAKRIGEALVPLRHLPPIVLLGIVCFFEGFLTEFTSNVGVANITLPVIAQMLSPRYRVGSRRVAKGSRRQGRAFEGQSPWRIAEFKVYKSLLNKKINSTNVLVSLDVVLMFLNIPMDLVILSIGKRWIQIECNIKIPYENFISTIEFILTSTYFTFNNKIYKQIFVTSMGDELRSGQPIDHKTVLNHLHKVGYKKKLDVWVPHELSVKNMMDRINLCDTQLKRNEIEPFLKRMITDDEKWITYDNRTRKRLWIKEDLQDLNRDTDIIVLPADKDNTTVVKKIKNLLSDKAYKKLDKDPTNTIAQNTKILVEKSNIPLHSPTYNLSHFLAQTLQLLTGKSESHITNSTDFIQNIQKIRLRSTDLLVSFDVECLFTQVPIKDILNIIKAS
ncbi:INDY1 protein, partial [Acromyrmex heyeri]